MPRMSVILAGGSGDRLFPYTTILPKPLLPINGRQIIGYIIDDLYESGICKHYICIAEPDEDIFKNYLGVFDFLTYNVSPVEYNTAGRLLHLLSEEDIEDSFILHYGDIITNVDYDLLWKCHEDTGAIATIVVKRGWKIPKGLVRSEDGVVTEFIERYPLDEDIWIGVAALKPEVYSYIDSPAQDIGSDLFPTLVEEGEEIRVFDFNGFFFDIGTQKDYRNAKAYLGMQGYF